MTKIKHFMRNTTSLSSPTSPTKISSFALQSLDTSLVISGCLLWTSIFEIASSVLSSVPTRGPTSNSFRLISRSMQSSFQYQNSQPFCVTGKNKNKLHIFVELRITGTECDLLYPFHTWKIAIRDESPSLRSSSGSAGRTCTRLLQRLADDLLCEDWPQTRNSWGSVWYTTNGETMARGGRHN